MLKDLFSLVTIRELLLIIMTKLDNDIIAWLHLIQNFLPSAFIQEALLYFSSDLI
jgi:hypothetical protein